MEGRERGWLRGRENERRRHKAGCGRLSLQSLRVVAEDENKCTQTTEVLRSERDSTGTLLRGESYSCFFQEESASPLAWTGFYCFSWVLLSIT